MGFDMLKTFDLQEQGQRLSQVDRTDLWTIRPLGAGKTCGIPQEVGDLWIVRR
jgi:hypothetical protein